MNRIAKIAQTTFTSAPDPSPRRRAARGLFAWVSALGFLLVSAGAHAACGSFGALHVKDSVRLPMLGQMGSGFYNPLRPGEPAVVGLWHVIYTNGADQSTFNDTFDTWHDDGTEFENAYLAPAGGNVCEGVWKQTGPRSVALHHVGWLFDPSNLSATASNTFTLDESITVARDGATYSGTFTFKIWNLDGSPTPVQVTGTIAATRITVN
jgi:hypothetical protein